ncbi:oligosaccharide flippase family protein [Pseudomonas sp.]|uniref:oligosaccharide flippase family protein n=1 Tax=unclassified Pseudomonas TaxID=196821 RepID=UPI0031DE73BB
MKTRKSGYHPGRLAHSALITLFWQVVRIGLLAAWMIVTARLLGPDGYGTYSGLASLAITLGAFTGLGLGFVMYQGTVHKPEAFSQYWTNTLLAAFATGLAISLLFLGIGKLLAPITSTTTLLAIGISETLLFPMITTSAFAFSAHERLGWATMLPAMTALFRLGGNAAFFYVAPTHSVEQYVWFHAAATFLSALFALTLIHKRLRPEIIQPSIEPRQWIDGIGFTFSWSGSNALTSLDKTFTLKFGGAELAGIYSLAYRFVTLATQPIDALVTAAMPRLFAQGAEPAKHPRLLGVLLTVIAIYGVVAGVLVWEAAAVIPLLLGENYTPAVATIQVLALIIPFYGVRVAIGNTLLGRRQKKIKAMVEFTAIPLMGVLMLILLPRYGIAGAAYACISVEVFLAVASLLALFALRRAAWPAPKL